MISKENFFGYDRYVLSNDVLEVSVITLGATVTSIRYRGREMTLGYPDAQGYIDGDAYIGAIVGRVANRIGSSRFALSGKEYLVTANEGKNQLHGGPNAFDKRRWQAQVSGDSLRFYLISEDGENAYPGKLTAWVTYTIDGSTLRIDFEGESDADTVFAPTTHMYFKLDDFDSVLDTELMINSSAYLEIDDELIPTGRLLPTEGDFDFKQLRKIGVELDHCFVIDGELACMTRAGGVTLRVKTNFPAVQIYTSGALGEPFGRHKGIAIEPEFYPDSPNHPNFPSILLKKDEKFHKFAEFIFE